MECLDWLSHNGGKPPRGSRRGRMIYGICRKRDSKSPRRPLCRKGGEDDVQPVLRGRACRAKEEHFWTIPAPKGSIQWRKADDEREGFLGATHSQAVKVATHGNASGQRPPPSPVQPYRGIFGLFFFSKHTRGEGEGGDRLTPMSAKKPGLNKEKKPSRPPREFRPYLVWPAGNFFTLPSRFQLCPSSSSAVPSPYCTCSTPCLRQGPQLAGQVVGRR